MILVYDMLYLEQNTNFITSTFSTMLISGSHNTLTIS